MGDDFPHGLMRGYRRHLKEKTAACEGCLAACRRDKAARTRAREAAGKPTPWAAQKNQAQLIPGAQP